MADHAQITSPIAFADVYNELRRIAADHLSRERPGQTLQPTALVHEAYLRLLHGREAAPEQLSNRSYFFAAAAEAMRRILIDAARRKGRQRRGGAWQRVQLGDGDGILIDAPDLLIDLDDALTRLAHEDAQAAEVAQLRIFGGRSIDEAAEVVGVSRATAFRQWTFARAWLRDALSC